MKIKSSIIVITTILSISPATDLFAQEPLDEAARRLDEADHRMQEQARRQTEDIKRMEEQAQRQSEVAQNLEEQARQLAGEATSGNYALAIGPDSHQRLQSIVHRTGGGGTKPMLIRSSEIEAKDQNTLEEDLPVMSHILEKAAGANAGPQRQNNWAMGVPLVFGPGSNPARSIYLEGYGAVFTLNVGFPLLPGPKADSPREDQAGDSTWEEARKEIYGSHGEGKVTAQPGEAYDESKVIRLKDSLIEALRNAANIRGLKAEDSVTVCVAGGASATPFKVKTLGTPNGQTASAVFVDVPAPMRETVLTLRVKKADAEQFAKGKITLEQFRDRVKVAAYPGPADGGATGGGGGFGRGGSFSSSIPRPPRY